jgi:ferredoxin--NADP+ reductase
LKGKKKLETVVFEKNALSGEPFKQSARGTGELEELKAGILFRSIGYRGVPLDGVPFHDAWGVIPNIKGRVTEDNENKIVVPQLYTAGWIKRGPSGIIGTNKACANETIEELMSDLEKLNDKKEKLGNKKIHEILEAKKVRYINFIEWEVIDKHEVENGKPKGKPREKFTYTEEMLGLLN